MHLHNVIGGDEGHLCVYLCKLGLTVSSEVLVAEATGKLEILVVSRYHKQLLIELGRLRKRVELTLMHTAGHEIISRSLGRGLTENRSFDINKAVLRIVISRYLAYLRARYNVSLHIGTTKIKITMLESELCVYVAVLNYLKGRCSCRGKDLKLVHRDLYLTRGEILIDSALAASADNTLCAKSILCADAERIVEYLSVGRIVESELNDTASISEVNEYQSAEISLLLHPTHNADSLAEVLCCKLCAIRRSFVICC